MKYLFLLFLFFLFVCTNAQNWSPPGAKWHYTYSDDISFGYYEIVYTGDTVIQGKNCQILQKTSYGYKIPGKFDTLDLGQEFTYSDSNRVYKYQYGKFYILYDFNAQKGDSWETAGDNNWTFGCDTSGFVQVDSVAFVVIKGDTLKKLYVSKKDKSHYEFFGPIVEKIGCLNYMFPMIGTECGVAYGLYLGPLRCYEDSAWGQYDFGVTDSCTKITTAISKGKKLNSEIEIYPNPFSDNIHISLDNSAFEIMYIDILSIQGQLLKRKSSTDNNLNFEVSDLHKGPYLIRIRNKNQNITRLIIKM